MKNAVVPVFRLQAFYCKYDPDKKQLVEAVMVLLETAVIQNFIQLCLWKRKILMTHYSNIFHKGVKPLNNKQMPMKTRLFKKGSPSL
jgi:type 1 glutamine amidotransferase